MSALKDMQKKDVTDLSDLEMCILVTHDPGRYDGYYVQPSVAAAELARLQAIEAALTEAVDIIRSLAESHHINMQERGNKFHPGKFEECPSSICKSGREKAAELAAALGAK